MKPSTANHLKNARPLAGADEKIGTFRFRRGWPALMLICGVWFVACHGDTLPFVSTSGREGAECYADGTCDFGLTCESGICVAPEALEAGSESADGGQAEGDATEETAADQDPAPGNIVLTAGTWHACALLLNQNTVRCWGDNAYGQQNLPAPVGAVRQVASGDSALGTCMIDDGGVHCVGYDPFGALASVAARSFLHPQAVSVEGFNVCAADDTGVGCWGIDYNYDNTRPQISVPPVADVDQLDSGGHHTCALGSKGLDCWTVDNHWGQVTIPAALRGLAREDFIQVSTGGSNTCALTTDRKVTCWGYGGWGVHSVPSGLANPRQISVGYGHACALDDEGVTCWGYNHSQFDANSLTGQCDPPALHNPRQVSAGGYFTCATDDDGVKCWGENVRGQTDVPVDLR